MPNEDLITAKEASKEFGLATWTINEARRRGKITYHDFGYRSKKFKRSDIVAFINKKRVKEVGSR